MSFTTIEEYNNYLVKNKSDVDIIEYVKEINKLTFNIDISFIDDFIKLVDSDTCCIHHSMLQKYGVSNLTAGSSHVIRLMKQNGFINNKDYKLTKLGEFNFNGGRGNKKNIIYIRLQKLIFLYKPKLCFNFFKKYQNSLRGANGCTNASKCTNPLITIYLQIFFEL